MAKITPFLWFNGQVEEAVNFYVSVFKNSKVKSLNRQGGTVFSAIFELDGQDFFALNGGPHFTFSPAVSFFVNCETQPEIDDLWAKLTDGGEEQPCGWLKDKYGLSWQIIPSILGSLLQSKEPEKAQRAMKAMLQMKKLDIAALREAHDG